MRTTRRRFMRQGAAALAVTAARGPILLGSEPESARKRLAHRRRRIIFNDDGDDIWNPRSSTPEGFISVRIRHMLDTQADTLFYSTTQSFNYYTHNTRIGDVFLSRSAPYQNNQMQPLLDLGTDPLALAVAFTHRHSLEAIWTLRMNDIHDAFTPPLFPQWKRDHPDALLGKREDWSRHPPGGQRRWWAGVDFNRADVRRRTVELIAEVARNYDVDGIDLDWLRHPIHFPETLRGEPVTAKELATITDLVRTIRRTVEKIGSDRGRPVLLSARVPLRIEHGLYMGTDVETWLEGGLVDFLTIGGGYVPYSMPCDEIVSLGHRHDVPVYPCISHSGMLRRKPYGPGTVYGVEGWRGAAANAFAAKADGVSLFNLFPAPGQDEHNRLVRRVFAEIGTPATLAGKDKLFCLDNAAHLATCGYTNHVVPYEGCLPKSISPDDGLSVTLPVGDDVARAKSVLLRVQTDVVADLACRLNGRSVAPKPSEALKERFGMAWAVAEVEPASVKPGDNAFDVRFARPSDRPTHLTGLELLVRYA